MLGKAVTEVVLPTYLMDCSSVASYLVLEPELAELDVPNLAEATPVGFALGGVRVGGEGNTCVDTDVPQHAVQSKRVARPFHHAIVFRLPEEGAMTCWLTDHVFRQCEPNIAMPPLVDLRVLRHPP